MPGCSKGGEALVLGEQGRAALLNCASGADHRGGPESCGLILGRSQFMRRDVHLITRCRNVAPGTPHPRGRWGTVEIDPGHLVRATKLALARGMEVLGTWHSHPGASGARALSLADLGLLWENGVALVVVPDRTNPALSAWTLRAGIIHPLMITIEKRERVA